MGGAQPGDPLEISANEWNELRRMLPRTSLSGVSRPFVTEIYIAKAPITGIPARVSDAMGYAECEFFSRSTAGLLESTGRSEICYNFSGSAIAGSAWIIVGTEYTRRDFIVIAESCEEQS